MPDTPALDIPRVPLDAHGLPAVFDAAWARFLLRVPTPFLWELQYRGWPAGDWTAHPEAWEILCKTVVEPATTLQALAQTVHILRRLLTVRHLEGPAREGCDHLLVTLMTQPAMPPSGLHLAEFFDAARARCLGPESTGVPLNVLSPLLAYCERQNKAIGYEVVDRLARELLGPDVLQSLAGVPWTTAAVWEFLIVRAAHTGWPEPLAMTVRDTLATCADEPGLWTRALVETAGGAIAGPGFVARLLTRPDAFALRETYDYDLLAALPAAWWTTLAPAPLEQLLSHPHAAVRTVALLHVRDVPIPRATGGAPRGPR